MLEMIKKIITQILKNKSAILLVVLFCGVFGFLFNINNVEASAIGALGSLASNTVAAAIAIVLGWIAYIITAVIGLLITLLIKILVSVAQFNNIIDVETVRVGWVIVRDLCNMFFVLILLVIAFATILKIENYNVKKLLPKLLIMAVLINFSKTIFGLIIDFSQVIMLTFVSGFANSHGWFIDMFRVQELVSGGNFTEDPYTQWTVVIAIIAGVFAAFATLIVIAIMLAILVMRIIMLWIYTILSPLIFLSFAFPPLQKYTSRIWEDFVKQVMVGPILAFFIWLALTTAKTSSGELSGGSMDQGGELCVGASAFFCNTNFQGFIITIGLLIGGLVVTQQLGGMAGAAAGKGIGWIKGGAGMATGAAKLGAKTSALWAGRKLDTAWMGAQKLVGVKEKNVKSLNYRMIKEGWDRNKADKIAEYESGLSGVWQDRFHRASTTQDGVGSKIPLYAAGRRMKARKDRDEAYKNMQVKEAEIESLQQEQEKEGKTEQEKAVIGGKINTLKGEIANDRRSIITAREKLPESRQYNIEKQRKISELHSEVSKENHDEDGLIEAYLMEKNQDKKRAYFQHLVDINGVNNLAQTSGKEMNFKGIIDMLNEDFKDEAGDVAADMSKRAEAAGNSKLIGFSKRNISTGKNELVNNEKIQINIALSKNKEKFDQSFARNEHFDSLINQDANGNRHVSALGLKQILADGQSSGRMNEIEKGNFQDRYGKSVAEMFKNKEFKDVDKMKKILEDAGMKLSDKEFETIEETGKKFYDYYDPKGIEDRKKPEEKNKESKDKKPKEKKPDSESLDEELGKYQSTV